MFDAIASRTAAELASAEPTAGEQRRAARARVERQMAVLDRLVEIGMGIAEEAGRQAPAPAAERALQDPGLTYGRAARAVRLTIALQQRLAADLEKQGRDEAAARRSRIGRLVERVIEAESDDEDQTHHLAGMAWERLTEEEHLDQVAGRPIGEIVARICHHLGLSPEAWIGEIQAEDIPALGEAPDAAEVVRMQDPASTSQPRPPAGKDPRAAGGLEPAWARPDG